jgi:hypothetical protein
MVASEASGVGHPRQHLLVADQKFWASAGRAEKPLSLASIFQVAKSALRGYRRARNQHIGSFYRHGRSRFFRPRFLSGV